MAFLKLCPTYKTEAHTLSSYLHPRNKFRPHVKKKSKPTKNAIVKEHFVPFSHITCKVVSFNDNLFIITKGFTEFFFVL